MTIAKSDWSLIREKIEVLFIQSFNRDIPTEYFDWRYFDNNHEQILFAIEIENHKAVASYSAFPVDLILNGKKCRTAMSMTTMTHPDWRGKGLFKKLATELYSQAGLQQIAAVWGFPNTSSHSAFNAKLGWTDVYEIPTLTLDLHNVDSGKLLMNAEILRDDTFSMNYPDMPNDGFIRVHRTQSYLFWRYAKNPVNNYQNFVLLQDGKVSSYIVTKSYGDGIDLVDIQTANSQEARVLLEHIVKLNFTNGVNRISCWAPPHHSVHAVLERLGFENTAPITYFGGRELIPSAMPSDWLNYKSWYIQMGDSDVY